MDRIAVDENGVRVDPGIVNGTLHGHAKGNGHPHGVDRGGFHVSNPHSEGDVCNARGENLALYRALGAVSRARLVASGGVSSLDDVRALRDAGLFGAIIGKAYYTGAIDLRRALEVAS